jgi:hypothetical protein
MSSLPGMMILIMIPIFLGIGIVTIMRFVQRTGRGEALQKAGAGSLVAYHFTQYNGTDDIPSLARLR